MIKYSFLVALNIMKKFLIFFVLIISHLSSFANGVNLSCSLDQSLCDRCPEYQTIFPVEKFSENSSGLDIEADQSEIIEDKYLLSGNVVTESTFVFVESAFSSDHKSVPSLGVRAPEEAEGAGGRRRGAAQRKDTILAVILQAPTLSPEE